MYKLQNACDDREFSPQGLAAIFESDDRSKLPPQLIERIRTILSFLEAAGTVEDMNQPTFRLHPLKGDWKGFWVVSVRANWRIVFRFEAGKALDVDFVDYH